MPDGGPVDVRVEEKTMSYAPPLEQIPAAPPRRYGLPALVGAWIVAGALLVALGATFAVEQARVSTLSRQRDTEIARVGDRNAQVQSLRHQVDGLNGSLSAAEAHVADCQAGMAVLLRRSNAGVGLYNDVVYARNRWSYVYDFYLDSLLSKYDRKSPGHAIAQAAIDQC
jgi:hypothetical protein